MMWQTKVRYEDLQESALEHARQAEATIENTVQKRPLEVLAGTFVIGAFIGWLAGRK